MVKITCGAEAPERANQAWTVAATALAAGAEVGVFLTGEAVWFAARDAQPDLGLEHATPVADLVAPLVALGAVKVCTQCAARRELTEADLLDGCTIAGAATFVERVLQPDVQALVY
jgi:predicted peroxiredoxin